MCSFMAKEIIMLKLNFWAKIPKEITPFRSTGSFCINICQFGYALSSFFSPLSPLDTSTQNLMSVFCTLKLRRKEIGRGKGWSEGERVVTALIIIFSIVCAYGVTCDVCDCMFLKWNEWVSFCVSFRVTTFRLIVSCM